MKFMIAKSYGEDPLTSFRIGVKLPALSDAAVVGSMNTFYFSASDLLSYLYFLSMVRKTEEPVSWS